MSTLEEIRAKLLSQQAKSENRGSTTDNAVYPFWDTPEGKSTTIRFLPDADQNNTFFWQERLVIKLPFQGVKGEHDREVFVQVPCMEMYGETCPILAETRPWWKDDSLKDLARKYWKKKSYLFQGFVVSSEFDEKNPTPENPIRRFIINPSIFDLIKASLMDPEMEDLPTDFVAGRDFALTKTTKGQYANYTTSKWKMRSRSLSETEQGAIEQFGLFNLSTFLPKKPSAEELEAIKEMFQASVNDEAYDPERWSNFYRPAGTFKSNSDNSSKAAPAAVVSDDVDEEVSTPVRGNVSTGANDALARLQNRSATPASAPASAASPADAMAILRRIKENRGN